MMQSVATAVTLNREFNVPVRWDGRVAVLRIEGREAVPVFTSAEDPPAPPPGCAGWRQASGHVLNALLPDGVDLCCGPSAEFISFAELRRASSELLEAVGAFKAADEAGSRKVVQKLSESVVYSIAGPSPGIMVNDGVVYMFSSLLKLAQICGDTSWFASMGSDLLALLPADCGIELDPGTRDGARLPPETLRLG